MSGGRARASNQRRPNPFETGQPDPRPLTEYAVTVATVAGNTHLTVTLDQPCVIRQPNWAFINCATGTRVYALSVTVDDNRTIVFKFGGLLAAAVAFVDVPYQDVQVQNFQGGFVRPGGQWFRKPL